MKYDFEQKLKQLEIEKNMEIQREKNQYESKLAQLQDEIRIRETQIIMEWQNKFKELE